MDPGEVRRRLAWFERVGVLLLLVAAFVPRVRDITSPWDRELEGFQGSFFTVCALNYERLGVGLLGGYPVVNIDLPPDPKTKSYQYPNHPPTVPLLAWVSIRAFGPEGWSEAWKRGESPPRGTETAARLPFLAFHMAGLLALWWAVRQAGGAQRAMLALAIVAALPVSVLYGTLINYETPCLPLIVLGCGFHIRYLRRGGRRDLLLAAGSFFAGALVTFNPAFFVGPLVLQTLWHRGWRRAFVEGAALSVASLVPPLLHATWLKTTLPAAPAEAVLSRVGRMLAPLTSGAAPFPEWLARQWIRLDYFMTTPVVLAAGAGALLLVYRGVARRRTGERKADEDPGPVSLGLPLLAGGSLVMFFFYHHTWDGEGARNGQTIYLLNLVPACAVLTAVLLDALARPLRHLRGGFAPLVLLTSLFVLPGLGRAANLRQRWRAPGPADDPALTAGPPTSLPDRWGEQIAEVLPAGAIGFYPRSMGFTPAVSYYAWRTLLPVADEASYERALGVVIDMHGLVDAPRYIVLPRHPRDDQRAEVDAIRTRVMEVSQVEKATEDWEIWPVQ